MIKHNFPPSYSFNQPDVGLFLFDIGSDVYNGKTFIDEGNPIWGAIILGVIFLPTTLGYVAQAIRKYREEDASKSKKLLILLLAPILAAPPILIMTVFFIVYVTYVFARRCFQPGYYSDDSDFAENYKLTEAVVEANLQAVLGWFTFLFKIIKKWHLRWM